jgi:hypothetical protein
VCRQQQQQQQHCPAGAAVTPRSPRSGRRRSIVIATTLFILRTAGAERVIDRITRFDQVIDRRATRLE